ncbi:LSU ribosomal protein L31p [Leptospirillum ferriphilum]|jgi:large subunit ribosomal protein L31|nr:LSU ribosomal protein L31p [Leptospirillum ferriphilum]
MEGHVPSLKSEREKEMKSGIHPEYKVATVVCACGNTFVTRTTIGNVKLDICNECHPFFTGTQKIVDTEGRVDRFMKKYAQGKK